jgi:hypothetical protein
MQSTSKCILAAIVTVLSLAAGGAEAHHSGAMFADSVREITGTVKEFQWTNPHSWIQVNVETAPGRTQEWSIEWGSPNSLGRQGHRPTTFRAGDKVTMQINPMRDGTPAGGFVAAKFADGKTVGNWRQ